MSEKVLVTGGAGYLGSLLIPRLLEKGYKVELFDNFSFGIRPILHFATHANLTITEGDILDFPLINKSIATNDLIVHLAAIVGFPACSKDPKKAKAINLDGSVNIINNLSKNHRSIFASTGSTYGKVEGVCDENTPIAPLTLYGSTKAEAEKLFLEKDAVALRFATVFGVSPRFRLDLLINDFVYQAIHNNQIILFEGHFRRTFLHVLDAVRSFEFAIENFEKMSGNPYNIGDFSMNFTKKDIALALKDKITYYLHEADIGEDLDKRDYEVSYEKINKLGFQANINLDEGINELIKIVKHIKITNEWKNA